MSVLRCSVINWGQMSGFGRFVLTVPAPYKRNVSHVRFAHKLCPSVPQYVRFVPSPVPARYGWICPFCESGQIGHSTQYPPVTYGTVTTCFQIQLPAMSGLSEKSSDMSEMSS